MSVFQFEGTLALTQKGFAFVDIPNAKSILVPASQLNNALHGDTVIVDLLADSKPDRPSGKVTKIVSRKLTTLTGFVKAFLPTQYTLDLDERLPYTVYLRQTQLPIKPGTRVQCRILGTDGLSLDTEVISLLPELNSLGNILENVALRHPVPGPFSEAALACAAVSAPSLQEDPTRKDLRHLNVFTIDPETSRDFDDALSVEYRHDGSYQIGVHIADPTHYLKEGSPLDVEAFSRSTSIYLPGKVFPMLPEALSNVLCSLQPEVDRYAVTLLFDMNSEGDIRSVEPVLSLIRSKRRYTYEEAYGLLQLPVSPTTKDLHTFKDLALKLQSKRVSNRLGADLPSPQLKLDKAGLPSHIEFKENDISHQLIEEFMLLANEHVALFLESKGYPVVYRIHEAPDNEDVQTWHDLLELQKVVPTNFEAIREQISGHPSSFTLVKLFMRLQSKAYYSTNKLGHHSLGKASYAHFTSPIRRYSDILVHRVLKRALSGQPAPLASDLETKCRHISSREIIASRIELDVTSYLYCLFYEKHLPPQGKYQVTTLTQDGAYLNDPAIPLSLFYPFPKSENWEVSSDKLQARNDTVTITLGDLLEFQPLQVKYTKQRIDGKLVL